MTERSLDSRPEGATAPRSREQAWASDAVDSPETTRQAQLGKVFGYLKGLHATHLMDLGARLGLFGRLATVPAGLRPEDLAADLGLNPRYVRGWCETACALELLDYDPLGGYRLAPFMDEILGRSDSNYYLGASPRSSLMIARDYERYPELFRSGGVLPFQDHDEVLLRAIAASTRTRPRMFLDAVLPKLAGLQARLEAGASLLDVGCGAGYAIVEFAERYPSVRCLGLEIEPTSVGMAQELIRSRGLEARVEARLIDGAEFPDDLAERFDLVSMFLVLHEIAPELKRPVLAQCARALRPGGQLLLFDERYPSSPAELRDPSNIFAVMAQWYELTWGNVINTREEIQAMLAEHGLRVVDETSLSRFYIVTATRD